jgi:arylsulfatase A-like enzyme
MSRFQSILILLLTPYVFLLGGLSAVIAGDVHVWEKVEIELTSERTFENAYTDVEVWVDLKGPGFEQRCYGFWDGGDTFRVRVLATSPGEWSWTSGSQPETHGLSGVTGSFTAQPWSGAKLLENPTRRGMVGPSENGHAFAYADGKPFFLIGDTWWAIPTQRFPWREGAGAGDPNRAIEPDAGFQDYVAFRKAQEFNCLAMIAAFPNWHDDGRPARMETPDGLSLRAAWRQAGTDGGAKRMTNEDGERPFFFPGHVEGYEDIIPDLDRINPAYFQTMDRKIDFLNSQGFTPFIEPARRDIGPAWKDAHDWPATYTRYIQYVWSRYQANNCLYSPIHFDTPSRSISQEDWNAAANGVIDKFGRPPFGTLAGTNAAPSSLHNWGHIDEARWLGFHQIGNRRTHDCYAYLTEIFETTPPVPGINGEPYYDGMEDATGGTDLAALYCRSAMYGSVLSGGLGGHIYGAGGWEGGLWSGEIEPESNWPIWEVIQWPSADQMRHMKSFIMTLGDRYQELVPCTDLISPNKTGPGDKLTGWAYGARIEDEQFLLYFEKDCPRATLSGARPGAMYAACWFDPRSGEWGELERVVFGSDLKGEISLPEFPEGDETSSHDWALRLKMIPDLPLLRLTSTLKLPPPNVLLIMTDDQGWGDIHSHGNELIDTPVMDRLASEGARFDRFFVSPLCAPTRAALLTGRDHVRTGVTWVAQRRDVIRSDEATMAEMFQDAGYATACYGKWHSGHDGPHTPSAQGFDEFLGFHGGAHHEYFNPPLRDENGPIELDSADGEEPYITDILTDAAERFMRKVDRGGDPFFCYVPYNAPHTPCQVSDELFEKYVARGLDIRTATIYGMIESIDSNMGRLLTTLDDLNIADRTIVVFLTDNGPNGARFNGGMKGTKGSVHEGGNRVPCFIRWPGQIEQGTNVTRIAAHYDLMPTLAELCGVPLPQDGLQLTGRSLVPLLQGADEDEAWPERILFTLNNRDEPSLIQGAARTDRYRLVRTKTAYELYDMLEDPGQTTNIAASLPEKAGELIIAYESWFAEASPRSVGRRPIGIDTSTAPTFSLPTPDAIFSPDATFHFPNGPGWSTDWMNPRDTDWITDWTAPSDTLTWELDVADPGEYDVMIRYACNPENLGARLQLFLNDQPTNAVFTIEVAHEIPDELIRRPDRVESERRTMLDFTTQPFGRITLPKGEIALTLRVLSKPGDTVCELRGLELRPVD